MYHSEYVNNHINEEKRVCKLFFMKRVNLMVHFKKCVHKRVSMFMQ